jgi:hypothetical protein
MMTCRLSTVCLGRLEWINLAKKIKKKKAASHKLQAASLTASPRDDRMINERNNYEK